MVDPKQVKIIDVSPSDLDNALAELKALADQCDQELFKFHHIDNSRDEYIEAADRLSAAWAGLMYANYKVTLRKELEK